MNKPHIYFKLNHTYNFINTSAVALQGYLKDIDTKTMTATFLMSEDTGSECKVPCKAYIRVNTSGALFDEDYVTVEMKPKSINYEETFTAKASMVV